MSSNFAAVGWSPDRAYRPFVETDSARSIDAYTRGELMMGSISAFDRIGFYRGLCVNSARLCCSSYPRAATSDEEWNRLADAEFERVTSNPEFFDAAGKLDWKEWVFSIILTRFRVGDCGTLLTRTADLQPRIRVYEGSAIGDDPEDSNPKFKDGIYTDKNGKSMKFRIRKTDGHSDLQRKDFVFHCEYERPGQTRGIPKAYHFLNAMEDSEEIMRYWFGGIKASSQVSMQIVNSRPDGPQGMTDDDDEITPASNKPVKNASSDNEVWEMGDERIELLHDKRPSPDQINFLDYNKRDGAIGFGVPLEAFWDQSKLGGANVRVVMRQVQDFIDRENAWFKRNAGDRVYNWIISLGLKSGRLPLCKDPHYYKHRWRHGAVQTADFAKDMRAWMEMVNRGEMSPDRFQTMMMGGDADQEDDATIARWARRERKCQEAGLPLTVVFPASPGTAAAPMPADSDPQENSKNKTNDDE